MSLNFDTRVFHRTLHGADGIVSAEIATLASKRLGKHAVRYSGGSSENAESVNTFLSPRQNVADVLLSLRFRSCTRNSSVILDISYERSAWF